MRFYAGPPNNKFEGSTDQSLRYYFGDHYNYDHIRPENTARQLQSTNAVERDTKMSPLAHSNNSL